MGIDRNAYDLSAVGRLMHASKTERRIESVRRDVRCGGAEGLAYSFPLRSDFLAQFVLPYDLTRAEAERISAMLLTLVAPATDEGGGK